MMLTPVPENIQEIVDTLEHLTLPELVMIQTLLEDDGIYFYIGLSQQIEGFRYATPQPLPPTNTDIAYGYNPDKLD